MSGMNNGYTPQHGRRSTRDEPLRNPATSRDNIHYFRGLDSYRPAGVISHPDSDGHPLPQYDDDMLGSPRQDRKIDPYMQGRPAGLYHPHDNEGPIFRYNDESMRGHHGHSKTDPSMSGRPAGITYHPDGKGNPLKWMFDEDGRKMITPMPAPVVSTRDRAKKVDSPNGTYRSPRMEPIQERPSRDKIRVKDIKSIDLLVTLNDNTKIVISDAAFKPMI